MSDALVTQKNKPRPKSNPAPLAPDSQESTPVKGECNHCGTKGHYWQKCPYRRQKRPEAMATVAATAATTTTQAFAHLELLGSTSSNFFAFL